MKSKLIGLHFLRQSGYLSGSKDKPWKPPYRMNGFIDWLMRKTDKVKQLRLHAKLDYSVRLIIT